MSWCHCEHSGWCERHKLQKSENAVKMCQKHRDLFLQLDVEAGNIPEPSLIQQAANLAVATAEHVMDGAENVDNEEFNRRIKICEECPLFIMAEARCRLCGCHMNTKAKWRSGHCPDNPPRW